ncbi:MAG: hypothetical protein J4432_00720 [DPANN group archaeon]|nr:hypothetical protein [DPANN group archaeon]
MLKSEAMVYDLKHQLDLGKLSKLDYLDYADEEKTVLERRSDEVRIFFFSDGKITAFVEGQGFDYLKEKIASAAVDLVTAIEDIKRTLGLKFDTKEVLSLGSQGDIVDVDVSVRKTTKSSVDVSVLRNLHLALYDIAGDFQAERVASQAGELKAREFVSSIKPDSKDELIDVVAKRFKEEGIGILEKIEGDQKIAKDAVLRIHESAFAAGMPYVNRAVCNYIRGFLRGAFVKFKNSEAISVNETKCWGTGSTFCEFHVMSLGG